MNLETKQMYAIKVIDKSSGLITTEKSSFISNYSYEGDNGQLESPNAWVVINKQTYGGSVIAPQKLTGEWNVRVKTTGDNKTSINVNITNIEGSYYQAQAPYTPQMNLTYEGKSTGKFEKIIADYVK